MVELRLDTADFQKYAKDHYLSVRVGEVQKLAKFSGSRTYKFPSALCAARKYGRVEVFRRVGTAVVCVDPTIASGSNEVEVELEGPSCTKIFFDADVSEPEKGIKASPKKAPTSPTSVSQKAAAYLEEHHLEVRLSDAMQAVLRERPADPAAFMADILTRNKKVVAKLPKAPAEPEGGAPPAPPPEKKENLLEATQKAVAPGPAEEPKAPRTQTPAVAFQPSVGTWLAPRPTGPKPLAKAASTTNAVHPSAFLPSVGSWLAARPQSATSEKPQATTVKSSLFLPSVGTWLASRPASPPELPKEPKPYVMTYMEVMGPSFWESGLQPGLMFR